MSRPPTRARRSPGIHIPASGGSAVLDKEAGEKLYARLKWEQDRQRYLLTGLFHLALLPMSSPLPSVRRWQRRHPFWTRASRMYWLLLALWNFKRALIVPPQIRISVDAPANRKSGEQHAERA